jgi:acetyltransferase-like isoleucine patch superfamily enzyme
MTARIHPSAIIEDGVVIGPRTAVWDHVHVRHSARIGEDCIIGEKTYIAYGARIGDRVKINAFVYVCAAVTIEDGVMIGAGAVFTNDRFPRATTPDLSRLRTSDPDEHTRPTVVRRGATVGAHCTIGCDLEIGSFAMVGMGSVVTRSVRDFELVVGHPARPVGYVCRCGHPFLRFGAGDSPSGQDARCSACGRLYRIEGGAVRERLEMPEADRTPSSVIRGGRVSPPDASGRRQDGSRPARGRSPRVVKR